MARSAPQPLGREPRRVCEPYARRRPREPRQAYYRRKERHEQHPR